MKLSEFFKKLGIDLDTDIDDASKTTSELNNDNNNLKEEGKEMPFIAPKIDKSGFYDLTGIEDEEMKKFFKARNDERKAELNSRKAEDDKRVVNEKISKYASGLKFAEGWSLDDALKLGDFSKVVNDENIDKEIENAFTNLKTAKAGMFVADKETKNVSNPMLEGFNPKGQLDTNAVPNSFVEAFSMME